MCKCLPTLGGCWVHWWQLGGVPWRSSESRAGDRSVGSQTPEKILWLRYANQSMFSKFNRKIQNVWKLLSKMQATQAAEKKKKKKERLPTPGFEPGPPGWKPGILTTRPSGRSDWWSTKHQCKLELQGSYSQIVFGLIPLSLNLTQVEFKAWGVQMVSTRCHLVF